MLFVAQQTLLIDKACYYSYHYFFKILLNYNAQQLKQIKEMQQQKENGEWQRLRPQEQQQRENSLRTTGAIARFFNVMSNESMNALKFITGGNEND